MEMGFEVEYDKMQRIRLSPEGSFNVIVTRGRNFELVHVDPAQSRVYYRYDEPTRILSYRYKIVFDEDGCPEEDCGVVFWLPTGLQPARWGPCHVQFASGFGSVLRYAETTPGLRFIQPFVARGKPANPYVRPLRACDIRTGATCTILGSHKC